MSELYQTEMGDFSACAAAYEAWVLKGESEGAVAAREAMEHLLTLYAAVLKLPAAGALLAEDDQVRNDLALTQEEWEVAYRRMGKRLPFDMYSEVFDPLKVPAEEPVVGSVADDLADIYRDLADGLRLYRAGRMGEALWAWRLNFEFHWGEHASGGIRALDVWLRRNEQSAYLG